MSFFMCFIISKEITVIANKISVESAKKMQKFGIKLNK